MRQVIELQGRLPGLNDYIRANRSSPVVGNSMKRHYTRLVAQAAAGLVPVRGKCDIRFTWVEPNMRRDKDNIRFAAKFILDGLKEAGVIKDDGWKSIESLSDTFFVNKTYPRIIVEIEEVPNGTDTK